MQAKTIILDFDGVVCDSAGETYWVAKNVLEELEFKLTPSVQASFHDLRYLVKGVSGFVQLLYLLSINVSQRKLAGGLGVFTEKLRVLPDERTLENLFFEIRNKLWLKYQADIAIFNPLYSEFIDFYTRMDVKTKLLIASLKPKKDIRRVLEAHQVMIEPRYIFGGDLGLNKSEHMSAALGADLIRPNENIFFVDDNLDHLIEVSTTHPYINCKLALWGYNDPGRQNNQVYEEIEDLNCLI